MIKISQDKTKDIKVNHTGLPILERNVEKIIRTEKDLIGFTSNHSEYNNYQYQVYRYIYDYLLPNKLNAKFDLTILPPTNSSQPISRTRGHYHSISSYDSKQYFDIYQVVEGKIMFQTHLNQELADRSYFWIGNPGDIMVLPPDMCHVLYNLSNTQSILSNWCTKEPHLDYDTMVKTAGPAFEVIGINKNNLYLQYNNSFKKPIQPVVLAPISVDSIKIKLSFKSDYIFDWAFEGDSLSIMNNPDKISNWLETFSKPNHSHNIIIN